MFSRPSFVKVLCAAVLGVGLVGACQKDPPSPTVWKEGSGAPPAAGSPQGGTMPPPSAAPRAPAVQGGTAGVVTETMRSGGYTYARVSIGGKDVWAAGPEAALAVGQSVDLAGGTLMTAFRSDTLDRTFDEIYFVSSWGGGDPAAAHAAIPAGESPHGAAAPPAAPALAPGERIAPVAGGQTIEQIYAGKAALAGTPVTVHGKVVKFNGGIMGKNWLHLQDGTGAAGANDLIVTTQGNAAVGDVVVARGTIVLDKDLGAGYRYDVLLEDATLGAP